MKSGLMGQNADPNTQTSKEDFFNQTSRTSAIFRTRSFPVFAL